MNAYSSRVWVPGLAHLPETIVKPCCSPGKSCGDVTLHLSVRARAKALENVPGAVDTSLVFSYLRDNGDPYRDVEAESPGELRKLVIDA